MFQTSDTLWLEKIKIPSNVDKTYWNCNKFSLFSNYSAVVSQLTHFRILKKLRLVSIFLTPLSTFWESMKKSKFDFSGQ